MMQRAYSLLIVLLLAQSSFGLTQNHNISYQKCSEEQFEYFRKEQNPREYHLTIEESLSDVRVGVEKYFIEYQGEYNT